MAAATGLSLGKRYLSSISRALRVSPAASLCRHVNGQPSYRRWPAQADGRGRPLSGDEGSAGATAGLQKVVIGPQRPTYCPIRR